MPNKHQAGCACCYTTTCDGCKIPLATLLGTSRLRNYYGNCDGSGRCSFAPENADETLTDIPFTLVNKPFRQTAGLISQQVIFPKRHWVSDLVCHTSDEVLANVGDPFSSPCLTVGNCIARYVLGCTNGGTLALLGIRRQAIMLLVPVPSPCESIGDPYKDYGAYMGLDYPTTEYADFIRVRFPDEGSSCQPLSLAFTLNYGEREGDTCEDFHIWRVTVNE